MDPFRNTLCTYKQNEYGCVYLRIFYFHRYRDQTSSCQWGEGRGERQDRGKGLRGTNNA